VLLADPPWTFKDTLPGRTRGAAKNYDVLSLEDITRFELPDLDDNCWLFLWRVSAMVEEAYEVVRTWGFVPKTEIIWCKRTKNNKAWFGCGRYVRAAHETCIVATRGRVRPLVNNVRSRFFAPYTGHSVKPEKFYRIVEQLTGVPDGQGSHVELFARRPREGWLSYGNELEEASP
jgi:N6-adenosine-specific RNA methylase IME4